MSFSRLLDTNKLKRGREMMENLQPVIDMGNWSDDNSKPYAQLLCENVIRILLEQESSAGVQTGKKQRITASSSSIPDMSKKIAARKRQKISNWLVIRKEKADDGCKWKQYGSKYIKNEEHPRLYYGCSEEGCPVKKYMQSINAEYVQLMYFEDHNCKHQAHPYGFGCGPAIGEKIDIDWLGLLFPEEVPMECFESQFEFGSNSTMLPTTLDPAAYSKIGSPED